MPKPERKLSVSYRRRCELVIEGVKHNAQLHVSLLGDARFKLGEYYTDFMATRNGSSPVRF